MKKRIVVLVASLCERIFLIKPEGEEYQLPSEELPPHVDKNEIARNLFFRFFF
jgi:hypothetical protein